MTATGHSIIGGEPVIGDGPTFRAVEAASGREIDLVFHAATDAMVDRACTLAEEAFDPFRELAPARRADFLDAVAQAIFDIGDELIVRCMQETGLPRPRLEGERGRTVGQLRMFASVLREGSYLSVRIDPALPDRKPLPRPDLCLRVVGLGPVAIFGASNFPLAFSVAGGDTASALAAGCPVVVKAHPAHPGTSELVGRAVAKAVSECGLPPGVFSLLFDGGIEVGKRLVTDPRIAAVGFTGSRRGGTALMQLAAQRPIPIPVYAEMSSINPVILLPAALAARGEAIGNAFIGALTLGAGQFCTNPGLVLAVEGLGLDAFVQGAAQALEGSAAQTMLTPGIRGAYCEGVEALAAHEAVTLIARGEAGGDTMGRATLFATSASAFLADRALEEEVFGATSLLVRCRDLADIRAVLARLEGQLTAALHMEAADYDAARAFIPLLERRAGRILVNGFGTGVEVTHAMVHGGPFPATSNGRTTSVGSLAIERFLRPVCYQDMPDALLPPDLQASNPLGLPRTIDGRAEA